MKYLTLFIFCSTILFSQTTERANGISFLNSQAVVKEGLLHHGVVAENIKYAPSFTSSYIGNGTRFDSVSKKLYVVDFRVTYEGDKVIYMFTYDSRKVFPIMVDPKTINVVSPSRIEKTP